MKAFKTTLFSAMALTAMASADTKGQDTRLTQMYKAPCGWTFNTQARGGYSSYTASFVAGDVTDAESASRIIEGPMAAIEQTLGYRDWVSLRLSGHGTYNYTSPLMDPGQSNGYLAGATAVLSVPFVANRESSLVFHPSIGFGWTQLYRKYTTGAGIKGLSHSRFFLPSAGLLVSFMPAPALTVKGGMFVTMPFGKHRASLTGSDPSDNFSYPYMKLHRRRHGLDFELEMDYKVNGSVSVVTKGEWKTLSAEGARVGDSPYPIRAVSTLNQFAVSMGVNFCY